MSEDGATVSGSGNVFRDLGDRDPGRRSCLPPRGRLAWELTASRDIAHDKLDDRA